MANKRERQSVINVEVDPELHLRLRLLTVKRRTSMRAVIENLIREWLEKEENA